MTQTLFSSLDQNEQELRRRFSLCDDVIFRRFAVGRDQEFPLLLIYIDNIANAGAIQDSILTNLMNLARVQNGTLQGILTADLAVGELSEIQDFGAAEEAILIGDTVLFSQGEPRALIASTKGWPTRGVPEAQIEAVVEGPKDAFTESMSTNIVLIRRRIRDTALKVHRQTLGRRGRTGIGLLYLDGVVRPEVVAQIQGQLANLDLDAILDSGQLGQLLEKDVHSPFPRTQLTERPDKAAAAILEGRVAVVVDNSPFVLLLPTCLYLFFQAAEDYYARWEIVSFLRLLRYLAAFLAVALPGLYLALTLYHPDLLPTTLAMKMAAGRLQVPFPGVVEVLLMELAFELLREAGVRLPAPGSSAIGIVGGIVIGQAAVNAGLVSPSVVIVAAATGICTFVIPNPDFVNALRLCKYLVLALSAGLGFFGFWLGLLFLLAHLSGLDTYGFPYLYPFCGGTTKRDAGLKDSLVRFPTHTLWRRPVFAQPDQQVRMKRKGR